MKVVAICIAEGKGEEDGMEAGRLEILHLKGRRKKKGQGEDSKK